MTMSYRVCIRVILLAALALPSTQLAPREDPYKEVLSRQKRQLGGEDACMQIYTVPKRTVKCDPSDEVRDALGKIQIDLVDHGESLQGLGARIDELDPDKEKQLPEEVQQRLLSIDEMQQTQAGHVEAVRRLDAEMAHVTERMRQVEDDDRAELATMIEQQSVLIQAALHQANASLHDAYLDRLTTSAHDLSARIQQLQVDLSDDVSDTETRMAESVGGARDESGLRARELSARLDGAVTDLAGRLREETANRVNYQNETERNSLIVSELDRRLSAIQEKVAQSQATEQGHGAYIKELQTRLDQTITEKAALSEQTAALVTSTAALQEAVAALQEEVADCSGASDVLEGRVEVLMDKAQRREHMMPRTLKIADCQDVLKYYFSASGVYTIHPDPTTRPFDVYCDMQSPTDDGSQGRGWTVVQRRQTGTVDFFRGWQAYKEGFGDLDTEFWLGLQQLYHMTHSKRYRLRVDLEDWDGHWFYAEYDTFSIGAETEKFALHVSGYHGNAGDSLAYHDGMPFSTMDNNNDGNAGICATWCRGAWWYRDCFESNLNGLYHATGPYVTKTNWGDGMVWKHIKGTNFYSLKSSVIKIIPVHLET